MKVQYVTVEGLRELDAALGDLIEATSSATGKGVLRKALIDAAQLTVDEAKRLAPVGTRELKYNPKTKKGRLVRLRDSITVSAKIKNSAGAAAFAQAMQAGLGRSVALVALRSAQRDAAAKRSTVEVYAGPSSRAFHAHLVEFGTYRTKPTPFMRPAWEATQSGVLERTKVRIGDHIAVSAERAAKRQRSARARGARNSGIDTRGSKG